MKKMVLTLLACCTFCMFAMATNSGTRPKRIEMLEQQIKDFKIERENIQHKESVLYNELSVVKKKKLALIDKIKGLESNKKAYSVAYFKALIEKKENKIKELTLRIAKDNLLLDISKINLNIDKANIELTKAEIKARKTPKIPLKLAKALIKRTKSLIKVDEATIKIKQAKIKEMEANIKYFENIVETGKKSSEIKKNTNPLYSYFHDTNIEIAKLMVKRAALILKLEQARRNTAYVRIKEAQTGAEFCKMAHKFCETLLKFNKVVDEKNLRPYLH